MIKVSSGELITVGTMTSSSDAITTEYQYWKQCYYVGLIAF